MARYEGVSASVIRRLPRYHRFLYDLIQKEYIEFHPGSWQS